MPGLLKTLIAVTSLLAVMAPAAVAADRRDELCVPTSLCRWAPPATATSVAQRVNPGAAGFEVNRGQFAPAVLFADHRTNATTYFTRSGPVVVDHGHALRLRFEGAARRVDLSGIGTTPAVTNYFIGDDPRAWRRNVPSVRAVRYREVWPGVDAIFRHADDELEYDLVLAPGVIRSSFGLRLQGAKRLHLTADGDLVMDVGDRVLRQHAPRAWEERPEGRRPVPVKFVLRPGNRVHIVLGDHDVRARVIIDPILSYSTYLGGSGPDIAESVAADPDGGALIIGSTSSVDFPTAGAGSDVTLGSTRDAFITKLSPNGAVVYSTYFGGSASDDGLDGATDGVGNLAIVGQADSADLPVTSNAPQKSRKGVSDGYLARFDTKTGSLRFATYYGGSSNRDIPAAVDLDGAGRAFFAGYTFSADYPTTAGAAQTSPAGNIAIAYDGFVTAIDTLSGQVLYSTYLGGTLNDGLLAVATDGGGAAWVTGYTEASSYPTTAGAPQRSLSGPQDAVLTKLTVNGALAFSTLVGGNSGESGSGVAVGPSGKVFLVGTTPSTDIVTTANAYQRTRSGGGDAFLMRWPAAGGSPDYVSLLGGAAGDGATDVVADSSDNAFIVGTTTSSDFPVRAAPQPSRDSSTKSEGFVAELSTTTSELLFSTYLGGTGDDYPLGIALGTNGRVTVAGYTDSRDYPTTAALQPAFAGANDAIVAQYRTGDTTAPDTSLVNGPNDPSASNAATFAFASDDASAGVRFECSLDAASYAPCTSPIRYTALAQGAHTFRVRAIDAYNNADATPAVYTWTVDAAPPDTTITTVPQSPINQTEMELRFTSSQPGSSFECRIDGGAFASCETPKRFSGLAEGSHMVDVRATDPAGNTDTSPATKTWIVDLTPPSTSLTSTPFTIATLTSASFGLASTEPPATFVCVLDGSTGVPCSTPRTYTGLVEGAHTFTAYAIDAAGNRDPVGAGYAWRIETTPPSGRIDQAPPAITNQTTATFQVSANEPATFECRLDGGAYSACQSPKTYTNLGEGAHTFQMRATDLAGKLDPNPPTVTWRIDLTAPTAAAMSEPHSGATAVVAVPEFVWAPSSDRDSSVESYAVLIDGDTAATVPARDCTAVRCAVTAPRALAHGRHTWSVRSVDAAGNTVTTAASVFDVDAAGPSAPDAVAPRGDAVIAGARPLLRWQAAQDDGAGVASHDVSIDGGVKVKGLPADATTWTVDAGLLDGHHEWSVVAVDRNGNRTAGAAGSFIVDTTPPIARFVSIPPAPYFLNQTITFDAGASVDPDGRIVRYEWDLDGDGVFDPGAGGPIATHTYNLKEPTSIAVRLRVTDQAQRQTTTSQMIDLFATRYGPTIVSLKGSTEFTNSEIVNLKIAVPPGATTMQISNSSGAGGFAEQRPVSKLVQGWRLASFRNPETGNVKANAHVYVSFLVGPIPMTSGFPGEIGVDIDPPKVTAPTVTTRGGYPVLTATVGDRGSGVAGVQVGNSKDKKAKTKSHKLAKKTKKVKLKLKSTRHGKANGALDIDLRKKAYVRVEDTAGNWSPFATVAVKKGGRR